MSLKGNKPLVLLISLLIFHFGWVKWWALDWFYAIDYFERAAIVALFVAAFGWPKFVRRLGIQDFAAIILALVGFAIIHYFEVHFSSTGILPQLWSPSFYPSINAAWLKYFDISVGLILVAVSEEIVYRKLAFDVLVKRFKAPMAYVLSSLLFAALHVPLGSIAFVITFLDGFVFMAVYRWRRNLLVPIAAHFLVDLYFFYNIHEIFAVAS